MIGFSFLNVNICNFLRFVVRESDCSTPKSPVKLAAKYSFASDPGQGKLVLLFDHSSVLCRV